MTQRVAVNSFRIFWTKPGAMVGLFRRIDTRVNSQRNQRRAYSARDAEHGFLGGGRTDGCRVATLAAVDAGNLVGRKLKYRVGHARLSEDR